MSQFSVPVVVIGPVEKHPNADTLSITQVEGCPVIFQTVNFKEGDYAIYVPVDAVVPVDGDAFGFLKTKEGQKTARVRRRGPGARGYRRRNRGKRASRVHGGLHQLQAHSLWTRPLRVWPRVELQARLPQQRDQVCAT